jgi:hypothetical protein
MNKILKSLKRQSSLSKLVSNLKSNKPVDTTSYEFKDLCDIRDMYIRIKWCKFFDDQLTQFESLLLSVKIFEVKKEEILRNFFDGSPGLRQYLILHSHFDINSGESEDWLVKMMLKYLEPTDDEIKDALRVDSIPDDIMDKLSILQPEVLGICCDDIKIKYGMWMRDHNKRPLDPICVIDKFWDSQREGPVNVKDFIGGFEVINLNTWTATPKNVEVFAHEPGFDTTDYDLPF